jgi:hypothetical protein
MLPCMLRDLHVQFPDTSQHSDSVTSFPTSLVLHSVHLSQSVCTFGYFYVNIMFWCQKYNWNKEKLKVKTRMKIKIKFKKRATKSNSLAVKFKVVLWLNTSGFNKHIPSPIRLYNSTLWTIHHCADTIHNSAKSTMHLKWT